MPEPDSSQMVHLKKYFNVSTEAELLKAIQEDYERETGWRPSKDVAEALLDRLLEAEYQRIAGGAYDER